MTDTIEEDLPKPLSLSETWASPEPTLDFVLPGLVRGTVGNIVAAGGTGKSFVMLATALGIGVGRDVAGIWGATPVRGKVVFLSLEDIEAELKRRLHVLKRELAPGDCDAAAEGVAIYAAAGRGLAMATQGRGGVPKGKEWFRRFADEMRERQPRLLVIDTLNRFLGGLSENDGGHMAHVLNHLERLAREAGCAIVLCHHASKAALSSGSANEAHAARGSSVITDNARWQCNLSKPRKDQFKGWSEDDRKRLVVLEFAKLNYGEQKGTRLLKREDGGMIRYAGPQGNLSDPPRPVRGAARRPIGMRAAFKLVDVADA